MLPCVRAPMSRAFSTTRACAKHIPLQSAVLMSRAPVVLQEPSALEREYYRFNTELSHRIQQPFPRDHYFKKGSAAESRFEDYYAKLQKSWDGDELLKSGANASSTSEASGSDSDMFTTMPRTTEADAQHDTRSLERALDRTLYLLVRNTKADTKELPWHLPTKNVPHPITSTVSLHSVGMEAVRDALGSMMDTWLVSKLPIAVIPHGVHDAKTYVVKAHILAGEPVPVEGVDYAWLTREEIAQRLSEDGSANAKTYREIVLDLLDA
ncbi:large subunit ribosomal protein L46 [Malassezia restricta]|uniref:large subunit ribosomal protein L46 n=1 Tax=Malassezia restricta TaxID=76775 RepID=UPI000DD140E2|nr:large subunit ribosomal protein L46 [Malassezia restricta]AXA49321.1 large subunit ribosomal protein L46 [Malassezia restricta]